MSKDWTILLLVAALLTIGFGAGWFARGPRKSREAAAIEGVVLPLEPRPVQMEDFWDDHVSNLELLTVVPESVSRPDDAPPGGTGPGHTTSTFLLEWRLGMAARYPIPGTPEWDARMSGVA